MAGAARAVQAVWEQRGPEAPPGGGGRGLGAFDERSESTDRGVFGMFVNLNEPLKQPVLDWCQS